MSTSRSGKPTLAFNSKALFSPDRVSLISLNFPRRKLSVSKTLNPKSFKSVIKKQKTKNHRWLKRLPFLVFRVVALTKDTSDESLVQGAIKGLVISSPSRSARLISPSAPGYATAYATAYATGYASGYASAYATASASALALVPEP
jgi:hypothetical protein